MIEDMIDYKCHNSINSQKAVQTSELHKSFTRQKLGSHGLAKLKD